MAGYCCVSTTCYMIISFKIVNVTCTEARNEVIALPILLTHPHAHFPLVPQQPCSLSTEVYGQPYSRTEARFGGQSYCKLTYQGIRYPSPFAGVAVTYY